MINLRQHQNDLIEEIRSAFKSHKSVLAQAPVGFGKTVISAFMGKRILEKNNTMFFCVHTKDLLTQTCKAFDKFNIPFGIIAAGYQETRSKIQICSIPTLKNRINKYPAPKMVVIDECHFCGAEGWAKMVKYYRDKGCFILGLSGSPWRMSGHGLGEHFDVMVHGAKTQWLIKNKYLSEYKIFAPSTPNLGGIHIKMGDYDKNELSLLMDKPSIVGSAVEHYKKYASGKNSIAFCTSIDHSKHTAESFNASGIPAKHLDGECDIEYRKKAINDFADGKIKIITNCALFSAGFDLSLQVNKDITVESVILLRPTMSLSLFIQMTGRALRYKPYPAIILDHANCTMTHGFPDDDREWSLEGTQQGRKNKNEAKTSIKICPGCFSAQASGLPGCKYCGFQFPVEGRKIAAKEGDLIEIDPAIYRRARMAEQGKAVTLEDLIAVGRARKYRRPELWAKFLWNARQAKRNAGRV